MTDDQFPAAKRFRNTSWSVAELEKQIESERKTVSQERWAPLHEKVNALNNKTSDVTPNAE
jgi:hypothetical protein